MKSQSPTTSLSIQRSREYYGFVLYLVSWIFFVIYIIWSTFPESWLNSAGIYYYPNQKWALLLPIWTCGFLIFIVIFYMATNLFNTLDLKSIHTFTDNDAFILHDPLETFSNDSEYIPPLQDLPLYYVSRLFRYEIEIEEED